MEKLGKRHISTLTGIGLSLLVCPHPEAKAVYLVVSNGHAGAGSKTNSAVAMVRVQELRPQDGLSIELYNDRSSNEFNFGCVPEIIARPLVIYESQLVTYIIMDDGDVAIL